MKKWILLVTLIPLYITPVMAEPDLDAASSDACKCLEKPYKAAEENIKQIKQAQASGDMSNIAETQGELMGMLNASTKCFASLSKKYPKIDKNKELQNKVMMMVEEKCPNPATAMMKSQ
ncbi:hypothetical protein MNBD_GAMMA21-1579 [hydrothermal vent metagenome]|uniref:Uncharacterized protein n=1 Tax=hydrothermal vent metagenome TaxID=652676 RepID=A0A3B1AC98_9ZZZZ